MSAQTTREDWRVVADRRRKTIDSKIPPEWRISSSLMEKYPAIELPRVSGILTAEELRITNLKAFEIVAAIRERKIKSVDVVRAFCKRAAIAHQVTNCLAEILFDEALAQAAELDEYIEKHGKPKGMLHGLPVSVKEHIYLQGTTATSALILWADQTSPKDALIIKMLREQGAVFHAKTTNPQSLMAIETESRLFGRTLNPYNLNLTCGGSTGGEGALIAMKGSVLGIGTDIGGSIRVPSAFCGIFGLKPSIARLPHSGLSGLHDGMQNIIGVVGPMARSIEDLRLFCSAALQNQPWDYEPSLIEIPWRKDPVTPPRLRIGVVWSDGEVDVHPPITRALKHLCSVLEADGHSVIPWDTSLHPALVKVVSEAYFLDGGEEYRKALADGGEEPVAQVKWVLESQPWRRHTLEDSWKVNIELDRLKTAYAEQWKASGVDLVISPASPSVASAHCESRYWGYTCVFNALDLPAVVIPAGFVEDTDTWANFPPATPNARNLTDQWYRQLYTNDSGPQKYKGAPISFQIAGRRLQEEKLLHAAGIIENCLAGAQAGLGTAIVTRPEEQQQSDFVPEVMKPDFTASVHGSQEKAAVAA